MSNMITIVEGESFKPIFANTLDSIKDRAPNSLRKGKAMHLVVSQCMDSLVFSI